MRCKEVKQRIDKSADGFDQDILNHIKNCPSCARAAEAKRVLQSALQNSRSQSPRPETALDKIRLSVEHNALNIKKESFMSKIKNNISTRPRLATGFGVLVVAFVFFAVVPFSYTKTIGYDLALPQVSEYDRVKPEKLEKAMTTLVAPQVQVAQVENTVVVKNLPTLAAAEDAREIVGAITQYDGEVVIGQVTAKASAPLLAQISKPQVVVAPMAQPDSVDPKLRKEITKKLIKSGIIEDILILESDSTGNWVAYSAQDADEDSTAERYILGRKDDNMYYLEYKGNTIVLTTNPENVSRDSLKVTILKDFRESIVKDSNEMEILILEDGKESKLKIIIDEDNEL